MTNEEERVRKKEQSINTPTRLAKVTRTWNAKVCVMWSTCFDYICNMP